MNAFSSFSVLWKNKFFWNYYITIWKNFFVKVVKFRPLLIELHFIFLLLGEIPAAMQHANHSNFDNDTNNSIISGSKFINSGSNSYRTFFTIAVPIVKTKYFYSINFEYKIEILFYIIKSIIILLRNLKC